MAKFSRFDPRNKKKNKHKKLSLEKRLRVRRLESEAYHRATK